MSLNMMLRFGGAKREADVPETLGQQIAAGIKAELEDVASRISLPSSAKLETMPGCPAPGFCKNKKKHRWKQGHAGSVCSRWWSLARLFVLTSANYIDLLSCKAEYEDGGDGADPPINGAEVLVMHDVQPSARERWDEDVRPDGEGVEADCEASEVSPPPPMSDNMTFAVTRNLPGMPRKGAASVGAGSLLWVALQGRVAHPESVEVSVAHNP